MTTRSSVVPLLLALLVECGTRSEQPNGSGGSLSGQAGSSAARGGQANAAQGGSAASPSRAFGGAGAGGTSVGSGGRGGSGVGVGGVGGTLSAGGVAGALGTAGGGTGGLATEFTLVSTAVPTNGNFAVASTCAGTDTSPDLQWGPGVSQAQSYAVSLADAATGAPQWIVWDIPASVTSLPAGLATTSMLATPAGAKQVSTSGTGYVGPCPMGQQRFYEFSIYALPVATLTGVTTDSALSAIATAINLTPPIDVAVFGASAGMSNGGAAGSSSLGGAGGSTGMN